MNPWKSPKASFDQAYKPPSSGNRDESSLMTKAPGTKKKTAARIHRLIEEVPLCPAAAIQRGPRTVAILKSRTSQKPIVLRNCDFESSGAGAEIVIETPGVPDGLHCALAIIIDSFRHRHERRSQALRRLIA